MSNTYVYGRGRSSFDIPESEIRYAMEHTNSNAAAARFMRISYDSWRKYASMYIDSETGQTLFELHKNQAGVGIARDKFGATGGVYPIDEILEGKHPTYPKWKLRNRLIALDILDDKCNCCGYDETRITDGTVPLLLDHIDSDETNHQLDNLQLLCLNCYYTQVGNPYNKDKDHYWNYNLLC